MKVILKADVKSLGKKGELVNTSDGEAKAAFIAQKQSISCTFEPFEIKTLELNGTVLKEIEEIKI